MSVCVNECVDGWRRQAYATFFAMPIPFIVNQYNMFELKNKKSQLLQKTPTL